MSANRGQHVVPQFYLRNFAGTGEKLSCLDKSDSGTFPTSPGNAGKERDAFTIVNEGERDDGFDKVNNAVETHCAPHFRRLKGGVHDQGTIHAIWFFSANMIMRSRSLRDKQIDDLKVCSEFASKIGGDKALARLIEATSKILYPISQSLLGTVGTHLAARQCFLYDAPEGTRFISSDDPVVIIKGGDLHDPELWSTSFLSDCEVEVLIPLLPNVVCVWRHASEGKRTAATVEEYTRMNRMIAMSAYRHLFSDSESELQELWAACQS